MSDYKFKVGDKVNFIGNAKKHQLFGEDYKLILINITMCLRLDMYQMVMWNLRKIAVGV